jgi:hypothetical protein
MADCGGATGREPAAGLFTSIMGAGHDIAFFPVANHSPLKTLKNS